MQSSCQRQSWSWIQFRWRCFETYIFSDEGMREKDMLDVVRRITKVFQNKEYKAKVDRSDKRWIDTSIDEIFSKILDYLNSLV